MRTQSPRPGLRRRSASLLLGVLLFLFVPRLVASSDPASMVRTADALMAERHFESARSLYEQALAQGARFDGDLQHARSLGIAYLNSAPPDLADGIKWLRVALALDPRSDGVRAELAKALLRSGDAEAASENYHVLVDHNPQSADYVIGMASALHQAGNTEAALELFRTTLQQFPNLVPVRVEYARLLNFNRQFVEAKRQFSAVLATDSGNLIAQVGLAKATSFDGDQESALSMYDSILQHHPGLYDAIVGKAFSLLWSGHLEQARELLEEAARRNPNDREVREALSQMPDSKTSNSGIPASASGVPTEARVGGSTDEPPAPPEARNTSVAAKVSADTVKDAHGAPRSNRLDAHLRQPAAPALPHASADEQRPGVPPPTTVRETTTTAHSNFVLIVVIVGLFAIVVVSVFGYLLLRRKRPVLQASFAPRRAPILLPATFSEEGTQKSETGSEPPVIQSTTRQNGEVSSNAYDPITREPGQPDSHSSGITAAGQDRELNCESFGKSRCHHGREAETMKFESGEVQTHSHKAEVEGTSEPLLEPLLDEDERFALSGVESNATLAVQPTTISAHPEVLLIGGSENTRALESRRLSALNLDVDVECDWSGAVGRLASASPELVVLNAITGDGWTSVRMFRWITDNRPELRSCCLAIVSTSDAAEELGADVRHCLVEPFDSRKWHEAVSAVLPINALHHAAQP